MAHPYQWCSGKSGTMGTLWPWRARERKPITGFFLGRALSEVQGQGTWLGGQGRRPLKLECF